MRIFLLLLLSLTSAQAATTQLNALSWCRADGSDQTSNMQQAVNAAVTAGYNLYVPPGIVYDSSLLTNTTGLLMEDYTTPGRIINRGTVEVAAPGLTGEDWTIRTPGIIWTTNVANGPITASSLGMVGNNSTENSAALVIALATVPENATIRFTAGTYLFNPHQTYTRSNIKLIGDSAIFRPTGTNISLMTWSGTNVVMEGITFDGNNLVNRALELTSDSHGWTWRKCRFLNATEPGALSQQAVLLRLVESSSGFVIDDCEFFDVTAPNSGIARGILASVVNNTTYFRDIKILNSRFGRIGDTTDGDAIVIQNFTNQVGALIANCSFDIEKRAIKMMSPGGVIVNCYSTTAHDTDDLPYAVASIYSDNWQISNWQHVGGRTYAGLETGSTALTATNVLWSNCLIEYDADADLSAADGIQILGRDTRNVTYNTVTINNVRTGARIAAGGTNYNLLNLSVNRAVQRGADINVNVQDGETNAPTGVTITGMRAQNIGGNVVAAFAATNLSVVNLRSHTTAGVYIDTTNVVEYMVWDAYDPTVTIPWQYKSNWAYDPNFNRWHIGGSYVGPWAMNVLSRFAVMSANTNYFFRIEANNDGANSINGIGPWETSLFEYDDTGNRLRLGSSIGDFILSTTNAYSAGPIQKPVYFEKTGDGGYSVTAAKSGYFFSNADCSATFTTYNLPTPTAVRAEHYYFGIAHSNGALIQASGGATISYRGATSAANGYLNNTEVGDIVHLVAASPTQWVAYDVTGNHWKVDNVVQFLRAPKMMIQQGGTNLIEMNADGSLSPLLTLHEHDSAETTYLSQSGGVGVLNATGTLNILGGNGLILLSDTGLESFNDDGGTVRAYGFIGGGGATSSMRMHHTGTNGVAQIESNGTGAAGAARPLQLAFDNAPTFTFMGNSAMIFNGITRAARDAITPTNGMVLYQTDDTAGFRAYIGGAWYILDATADP